MPLKIAVVVGSLRAESFNRKLAGALTRLPAASGHRFSFADIGALPLYNQDDDSDQPAAAKALKALVSSSDGVLFVTPEYNRSMPGVLKNAIDHGSRPYGESCWAGKPAGVIGTSPGKPATSMAQQHLRNVLAYLDMPTLGQPEAFVQWSDDLLAEDGSASQASAEFLNGWMEAFVDLVEVHVPGD
ncbi:NADPH-dependent FMN reductase [Novosphingobium malaysiense]|uniref:NADPH-dependent FMN reductase n=1 Tax=Novosphingobium malaysiense TaxID=1348853 RepID=A0A0B1ZTB6_9SPHN|nr:NADPH-dependent FMN reductase [Novosphingobium malaysiense]KHK92388.1 NADPH-dependent FMN reductase [Novosphingobium malaysiense]